MAVNDSPERAVAREAVGKALTAYARVYATENDVEDPDDPIGDPIIDGWAVVVAINSVPLAVSDRSCHFVVVPNDQQYALTVGLFNLAIMGARG